MVRVNKMILLRREKNDKERVNKVRCHERRRGRESKRVNKMMMVWLRKMIGGESVSRQKTEEEEREKDSE